MNNRNHAFDLLCGLCILRMIMLHAISSCGYRDEYWFTKVMAWSFFFMSFFFFKAGYFNKGVSGKTLPYIKDRIKRLLTPYFVWGAIGSVIYFSFLFLCPDHFDKFRKALNLHHLWEDSHFYGNPPVWFLFSFFSSYILAHFLDKYLLSTKVRWIGHLLILAFPFVSYYFWRMHNPLWMSLNNVFMGVFFFYLGRVWKWLQTQVNRKWLIAISILLIAEFVVGNKLWHGEYDMSLNKFVQNPFGAGVNTLCALVGISGLLLALPLKRIPVIGYIGEHSMVFFVAHYPLIILYAFTHMVFGRSVAHHWDEFALMMAFILITCAWLVPYVEKNPFLSGRFPKKQ